jgi:uncharacterized protein (DUF1501 family)
MVVPYEDPAYYANRPTLAIRKTDLLPLGSNVGLNPAMASLMDAWNAKDFGIILGVGYPSPNLSHFRSIKIWETASDSATVLVTGWIARLFEKTTLPTDRLSDSLIVGETHSGPLEGSTMHNLAMDSIDGFLRDAELAAPPLAIVPTTGEDRDGCGKPMANTNASQAYMRTVEENIVSWKQALTLIKTKLPALKTTFPDTPFGRQVKTVAQILGAGADVPVVKLTLRGFDTHVSEKPTEDRLLKDLADGLASLRSAMIETGHWDDLLVLTYSEFGRRVGENGSDGTDHGTAAPMLILGGRLDGGRLFGAEPSLADLESGNLKPNIDFRAVYASVIKDFWGITDPGAIAYAVPGSWGPTLPLLKGPQ